MPQCLLEPFSDETAIAVKSRAIVPARICIGNKICIISFPLNSRHEKNPSVYKGLRGAFYWCVVSV